MQGILPAQRKPTLNWELLLASSSLLLNYAGPYHISTAQPRRRVIASSVSLGLCLSPFNMLILSITSWFHLIFSWVKIISAARTCWINSCCMLYSRISFLWIKGQLSFFLINSVLLNFYVQIDGYWIFILEFEFEI